MSCDFFQSEHDSQLGHLFKTSESVCVLVFKRETEREREREIVELYWICTCLFSFPMALEEY